MRSDLPKRLRSVRERVEGGGALPSLTVLSEAAAYIETLEQQVKDLRSTRGPGA